MTDRELMQQALDALETQERFWAAFRYEPHTDTQAAINALRDRLAQPKRQWVGLTDDDAIPWDGVDAKSFARAIEAKLKEKNTWAD